MYSDTDLDEAVAAGALSPEAAAGLRRFVAARAAGPVADEERFRLITGFNDVFVAIASLLSLLAVGWLAGRGTVALGGVAVALLSWGLAEYFTRRRRMALPSVLLLLGVVGGVFLAAIAAPSVPGLDKSWRLAAAAGLAAAAAWLHWRRFKVPVTVAAGVVAAVATVLFLMLAAVPGLTRIGAMPLLLAGGLVTFALAMRWDIRDRLRLTRRSDVAFWLHLAAAPMIVHPIFSMLGLIGGGAGVTGASLAVAIYFALALVALTVDRRALLVSALAYVFFALGELFQLAGALGTTSALAALVIGSALLLLSALWQPVRGWVVGRLPGALRDRLPPTVQVRS